jgi:hypothetical protein
LGEKDLVRHRRTRFHERPFTGRPECQSWHEAAGADWTKLDGEPNTACALIPVWITPI